MGISQKGSKLNQEQHTNEEAVTKAHGGKNKTKHTNRTCTGKAGASTAHEHSSFGKLEYRFAQPVAVTHGQETGS